MMNINSMGGVTLSLMAAATLALMSPTLPAFAGGERHSGHNERQAGYSDRHAGNQNGHRARHDNGHRARHDNGHRARHHDRHQRRHHRDRHGYGHYNRSGFGLSYYSNRPGLSGLAGVALLATAVESGRSDSYQRDREASRRDERYDREYSPVARDYPIDYDPVDALLDRSAELDLSYRQIKRLRRLQDDHLRETDHLVERLTFARQRLQRLRNDRYINGNDVQVARDRVVSLEERLQRTHARHEGHVNELLRAHRAARLSRR